MQPVYTSDALKVWVRRADDYGMTFAIALTAAVVLWIVGFLCPVPVAGIALEHIVLTALWIFAARTSGRPRLTGRYF